LKYNDRIDLNIEGSKKVGNFSFELNIDKPSLGAFYADKNFLQLFLSKNDTLFLSFDYSNFDSSLIISGTCANENSLLAETNLFSKP